MMRKRLLCAVLVLILLFSVQPMAAAANRGNLRSTTINANCRLPIIKVTVPTRAAVYINPLKLPVFIGGTEDDEQIISTPTCIANQSEVPLLVDVEVTGAVKSGSNMELSSFPTNGRGTDKRAFVYFEMQLADSDDPDYVLWDEKYTSKNHLLIGNGETTSKQGIVTLAARTLDGEVAEGGYAFFRLTGDAVAEPEPAWNSKDGISVTVAFTFTPLSYPANAK